MTSTLSTTGTPPIAAVTSIFTPPAFCGSYIDVGDWQKKSSLTSCVPSYTQPPGLFQDLYYSPAICPSGYTPGCTRWDYLQGPPLRTSETAIICCPRSFSCAAYNTGACVSGPRLKTDGGVFAVPVQVRWRSSDLSLFETPPLATGLPATSYHSGWNPDSSLLFPYTFAPDCDNVTDLWLPESKTTCAPLTGDYYSPAICPTGWTVAASRPLGSWGPPVEADETAMICCPSGLSTISVGVGCGTKCIAASIATGLAGESISLIQVRNPVQIRWASSDLSVLGTHPLTPGLILSPATVTVDPISHPRGLYGAALGIAFVPLILAVLAASCGGCILAGKRRLRARGTRESPRQQQHEMFKPSILKLPWLVALMGFIVTAIALVELSCHILPPAASNVQVSDLSITKVFVTDTIVRRATANSTLPSLPPLTCGMNGSYSVSSFTVRDSGTSVTVPITYGTTVCRVSNSPVALPSCVKPPTAPAPSNWLGAQQIQSSNTVEGSVEGAFFLANVFPTLVATLFAIPWKIMHLHATSLEPWHQMARPGGALFSKSILGDYTGMSAFKAILTTLTTCLVYLSAVITALASEAWGLGLVGSCSVNTSQGCLAVVQVDTRVVHIMQAFLGLVGLLALCLAVVLPRWHLGVWADPRNAAGITSLAHGGWVVSAFGLFDLSADKKGIEKRVGQMTVWLGEEPMQDGTARYGMVIAGNVQNTEYESKSRPGRLSLGRLTAMIGGLAVLMLGLDALVIYYILTDHDTGFERFMSGQGFGPRFLFSVCGIIINFSWMSIFKDVLLVTPYYSLEPGRTDTYMTSPYATDNYTAFGRGIKRCSPLLILAAFPTILGDFLPLLLASVPFNRATTWNAHWICSWFAVGQLTCMTVAALLLVVVLFSGRPDGHINFTLLRKAPIAAILVALSISGQGTGTVGAGWLSEEQHGITQSGYGEVPKSDQHFRQQVVEYSG